MATVSQSQLERLFEQAYSSHLSEAAFYTHKKPENWSLSPNKLVAAAVYCSAQRRLN